MTLRLLKIVQLSYLKLKYSAGEIYVYTAVCCYAKITHKSTFQDGGQWKNHMPISTEHYK